MLHLRGSPRRAVGFALAVLSAVAAVGSSPAAASAVSGRVVHQGIAVDMTVTALGAGRSAGEALREGDDALFRFRISDTASGTPLSGVYPAAWMDFLFQTLETEAAPCKEKVQEFVGGSIFSQAELDLNVYYVLALNDDSTISVVDPQFHYGDSKLLAMVALESPGEDWVLTADKSRLFVSMPAAAKVAVADTHGWRVIENLELAPARPHRVALQPDEGYLWVTYEAGPGEDSGVFVFDARSLDPAARLRTGRGRHEIAFSADSGKAFVTNEADGTLAVIDVRSLEVVETLAVGKQPVSLAYSALADAVYVSSRGDGAITAVDAGRSVVSARIAAEPGLGQIRFAPGGRYAFVTNPERDVFYILDASSNRIVNTADSIFGSAPDQIAFSDELAYVRHLGSEIVVTTPLDALGASESVSLIDVSGGVAQFGEGSPSPADGMVQAPGANAMLLANPADRAIYYYKEGMAAPAGSFQNYGRQPRAVLVVDRSLKERAPGTYETVARLRQPGRYKLAFYLDTPQIVHCFDVTVEADPELALRRKMAEPLQVEYLLDERKVQAGSRFPLRLRLIDPVSGAPVDGLRDVQIMAYKPPATRQHRLPARPIGDGVYEVDLVLPETGYYNIYTQAPSRRLAFRMARPLVVYTVESAPESTPSPSPGGGGEARP